jgi:hypothetical protein
MLVAISLVANRLTTRRVQNSTNIRKAPDKPTTVKSRIFKYDESEQLDVEPARYFVILWSERSATSTNAGSMYSVRYCAYCRCVVVE